MAVRIHVVGAWGASSDELRTALDSAAEDQLGSRLFRVGSSGRWQWAHASVWQVDGGAIDCALSQLAVPTFRVTTSDAVLWTLTLQAPGQAPFRGVHHFTAVGIEPPSGPAACADFDPDFPDDDLDEVAGIHRDVPALEFLWDTEEEARLRALQAQESQATVPGLDDYVDYGAILPPETIEAMRCEPHRAAYLAHQAHSRQIVANLEKYGFEFDAKAMQALLTTGPLTPREQDADVGNLPRFLEHLGVTGVFAESLDDEMEHDAESEDNDEPTTLRVSNYPPRSLVKRFDQLLPQFALSAIAGGAVDVPQLALLHLLSHLLFSQPDGCLSIQVPSPGYEPDSSWQELESLEIIQRGDSWRFCWKTPSFFWHSAAELEHLHENSLSKAVRHLPAGTRWDLSLLVDGLREKCHRYAGTYTDGRWTIEQSYPRATSEQLAGALALVAGIFDYQRPIPLLSDEETAAVRHSYLRAHDEPARIRGGKIKVEYGAGSTVVQTLLFERYQDSGPWDVRAARELVEQEWREFAQFVDGDDTSASHEVDDDDDDGDGDDHNDDNDDASSLSDDEAAQREEFQARLQQMRAALDQLQANKVVPHRGPIAYRGLTGSYWPADLADLEHLTPEVIAEFDAELRSLGFSAIGDFAADVDQRQSITRCYAGHPQASALASHRKADNLLGWVAMRNGLASVDLSRGTLEFHTDFADGSCLTTASVDGARSKPELGVFVRCYEDIPAARLWEKHQDGIRRFIEHRGTQPLDHRPLVEPSAYLARMDRLFAQFLPHPPQ